MIEVLDIWNRIARWWDQQILEGNDFQFRLINPITLKLLNPKPGQSILEIACGNGNFSRILSRLGCQVLATDGSQVFLDCAKARTGAQDGALEYRLVDACKSDALNALIDSTRSYDAIVCNMALMDLPTLDPLAGAIPKLLCPGGVFVFSVAHPCFNSNRSRLTAELVNEEGKLEQIFGVQVRDYLKESVDLSAGILNQPEPHPMFHRPLQQLIQTFLHVGLLLDGFEEPAYPEGLGGNAFSWKKRPNIPPAVVMRWRNPLLSHRNM